MTEQHEPKHCSHCQGGRKHFQPTTLMMWLGNELITVPDFPAWVCDMCGHRAYDAQALAQLSMLLNPEAGTPIQSVKLPPEITPPITTQPSAQ